MTFIEQKNIDLLAIHDGYYCPDMDRMKENAMHKTEKIEQF
jgi:hypothetical protein